MHSYSARFFSPSASLFLLIFVLSGFAGLIYQSIWTHYLGLFLGHAAYAQALVLSLFMGGMALGAALVSRYVHAWKNLIKSYAIIEAIIGILGLVFHAIFVFALDYSYNNVMPSLNNAGLIEAYKWLLASALIIPQTILLGMTFPLMCGGMIRRFPGNDGKTLGGLYFTNSIGAACGVLASTFLLLPLFGLPGAIFTAGVINILVALFAWWLSLGSEPTITPPTTIIKRNPATNKILITVLAATFFSSAASFAYEIIFVRMLSLAVGSTLHAFELMLAAFIAGIALGALWIRSKANATQTPLKIVGILQVLMGLTALLALAIYSEAFSWVSFLIDALSPTENGYKLFNIGTAILAIIIMLPTAFFAGTTLPLFTVALLQTGHGEKSIGKVYAWNTLGAILGVFAAIHLLIPLLGIKLSMLTAAFVDMAIGVLILRIFAEKRSDFFKTFSAITVTLVSLAYIAIYVPFDSMRLSSGVYRTGIEQLDPAREVIFYRDGKTSSISVNYNVNTGIIAIATNGKIDAAIQMMDFNIPTFDEPTMVLAATLPLIYKPNAETAAVIGFGSGLTTHTLLAEENLLQVDTIEIEKVMIDGARTFRQMVPRAFDDARSNIVIDDAKSYFSSNQHRYDIIISEPSNPWISGVGALFSQEFYQFIPRFLNKDGIFLQWLQLYEIDEQLVSSVLQAMLPEFADVHAYLANNGDLLLVASQSELALNPQYERVLKGELGRTMEIVGFTKPEQIAFRKVADKRLLRSFSRMYTEYQANSDFYPILSLNAPSTRFQKKSALLLTSLPTMNLPIFEALKIRETPSLNVLMPKYRHLQADIEANEARTIVSFFDKNKSNTELVNLPIELRNWLELMITGNRECWKTTDDYGVFLATTIHQLTTLTVPYVDASGLHKVLHNQDFIKCEDLPEGISLLLDFVEALAKRDTIETIKIGQYYLLNMDTQPHYLRNLDSFFLVATQLSLISLQDHDSAKEISKQYADKIKFMPEYSIIHSLLLAWLDE
ncbi:MAG: fused MFS/spermidine synthase [Paraglaciecola sp.]|nr:fused MFS/spermidine synthase [Paraglaciecola sp.]